MERQRLLGAPLGVELLHALRPRVPVDPLVRQVLPDEVPSLVQGVAADCLLLALSPTALLVARLVEHDEVAVQA